MNTKNQSLQKVDRIPQLRVRCDIRAGDDLSTCQMNVAKWQQRYQNALAKAQARGCIY